MNIDLRLITLRVKGFSQIFAEGFLADFRGLFRRFALIIL